MSPDRLQSELQFIDALRKTIRPSQRFALGIGDDCAVLDIKHSEQILVSTDLMTEGVHFKLGWSSLRQLGKKSVYTNISDIAAMGGSPLALFACLAIPRSGLKMLNELMAGIKEACREFKVTLLGGDTSTSRSGLTLSHTILGVAPRHGFITRGGARPGDAIFCSGEIGRSGVGLRLLQRRKKLSLLSRRDRKFCIQRFLLPKPRLKLAQKLRSRANIHAMIDVSDGLFQDLRHILTSSGVSAQLDLKCIPVPQSLIRAGIAPMKACSYGEDYELLFTAPAKERSRVLKIQKEGHPLRLIGRIIASKRQTAQIYDENLRPIADGKQFSGGFRHF